MKPIRTARVASMSPSNPAGPTAPPPLVHSDFEKRGAGWESMRDSVQSEGGWPDLINTYAKAAAAQ
ncbi:hypothetical protein ACQP2U_16615 [Nocardia sp. CA-084685]|uniref:hypothetical protein n=1 Tax=Nocardia sp. CA-084685 TaxID=3239970 RepID=UPI003D96C237